jgi:hypothetical protein
MAKQIILYNLAPHITDEQYKDYVVNEKGPLLDSFESVEKFELVKISSSMQGQIPYHYVGILHIKDPESFMKNDALSKKMQDFIAKWSTMVEPNFVTLMGEEIY